ncbi:Rid family hydrolase [Paraburkholderia phymatum]|uniref:Rid family hydrolase n=1 Tax=Paraburkholderia phymatum TaxID=148447 RepID=UPI0031752845
MEQGIDREWIRLFSGLTAKDTTGGIKEQVADILAQIDNYLLAAGSAKSRIAVANIWLKDVSAFNELNEVWEAWVDKEHPPRARR